MNLRKTGECYVEVSMNEIIVLSVKKACKSVQTFEIESSSVPVLRVDREDLNIHAISQNFVIPFIDGRNCVAKIAVLAKADEEIVKIALNYLMQIKMINLIDVFQFSNIYAVTKNVYKLMFDLGQECYNLVAKTTDIKSEDLFDLY